MQDMTFSAAQADMRTAYAGGVPGILVSGSVWMMAGVVALHYPPHTAVMALLAGGMLIFPLAVLLIISGRYFTFATLYGMRLYWRLVRRWAQRRTLSRCIQPTWQPGRSPVA